MRKVLYALCVAAVAGATSVAVQSHVTQGMSFGDTLKVILFGDATRKELLGETFFDGGTVETFKIMLTEFDDKNCTVTILNHDDKPGYGETKVTVVVDFKALTTWSRFGAGLFVNGNAHSPVFKSVRVEWLRTDTEEAKKAKLAVDNNPSTCSKVCLLYFHGEREKTRKAMRYLMYTLCLTANRAF